MTSPAQILNTFVNVGLPDYGLGLDYLPTDSLLEQLTARFNVEFAVTFRIGHPGYCLFVGKIDMVELPIDPREILIKHTHPRGIPHPSIHDINWLSFSQQLGSPQIQSVILPVGNTRFTFRIDTPYLQ